MSKALVLRVCDADLKGFGDFQWPSEIGAVVTAPDWEKTEKCGAGLHGWLYGAGDSSASSTITECDAKWLVVEVEKEDIVHLKGKVKFPSCTIRHIGDKKSATEFLLLHETEATRQGVIGATLTGGDYATLTGGDYATLTGGDGATLTGGNYATLTGGDGATLTGGDGATLTGGDYATLTGGYGATLTGGDGATLTGGDGATLTGGDGATLTGGDGATLKGGDGATLKGGDGATLIIDFFDGSRYKDCLCRPQCSPSSARCRIKVAYVGEGGIQPGKAYKIGQDGNFIEAD